MKQRGRKSKDTPSVISIHAKVAAAIEPPAALSDEEKRIWEETTRAQPPSFFDTPAPQAMLADYCRHKATANAMTVVINHEFKNLAEVATDVKVGRRYAQATRIRDRETRAAANLATKLRLTNQSRYSNTQAARRGGDVAKETPPWED